MRVKKTLLNINITVLFLVGLMDLFRGFMHTYNIRYAAANVAQIDLSSDNLVLMGTFGISNFLTAFIYFLILWKAKHLAPYILLIIPLSYVIGAFGFIKFQDVKMDSAFNGQYMMMVYLSVCLIVSVAYFLKREASARKVY